MAVSVIPERIKPNGSVVNAGREMEESVSTLSGVCARVATIGRGAHRERIRAWRKRKAAKGQCDKNDTASQRRPAD